MQTSDSSFSTQHYDQKKFKSKAQLESAVLQMEKIEKALEQRVIKEKQKVEQLEERKFMIKEELEGKLIERAEMVAQREQYEEILSDMKNKYDWEVQFVQDEIDFNKILEQNKQKNSFPCQYEQNTLSYFEQQSISFYTKKSIYQAKVNSSIQSAFSNHSSTQHISFQSYKASRSDQIVKDLNVKDKSLLQEQILKEFQERAVKIKVLIANIEKYDTNSNNNLHYSQSVLLPSITNIQVEFQQATSSLLFCQSELNNIRNHKIKIINEISHASKQLSVHLKQSNSLITPQKQECYEFNTQMSGNSATTSQCFHVRSTSNNLQLFSECDQIQQKEVDNTSKKTQYFESLKKNCLIPFNENTYHKQDYILKSDRQGMNVQEFKEVSKENYLNDYEKGETFSDNKHDKRRYSIFARKSEFMNSDDKNSSNYTLNDCTNFSHLSNQKVSPISSALLIKNQNKYEEKEKNKYTILNENANIKVKGENNHKANEEKENEEWKNKVINLYQELAAAGISQIGSEILSKRAVGFQKKFDNQSISILQSVMPLVKGMTINKRITNSNTHNFEPLSDMNPESSGFVSKLCHLNRYFNKLEFKNTSAAGSNNIPLDQSISIQYILKINIPNSTRDLIKFQKHFGVISNNMSIQKQKIINSSTVEITNNSNLKQETNQQSQLSMVNQENERVKLCDSNTFSSYSTTARTSHSNNNYQTLIPHSLSNQHNSKVQKLFSSRFYLFSISMSKGADIELIAEGYEQFEHWISSLQAIIKYKEQIGKLRIFIAYD